MAGIQLVYTEKDIEDILEQHCERMLGIKFVTRQFRTEVGIADIIAKHPDISGVYYVVEIKRGILDPDAYAQALRYAKWLNSEMSKDGRRSFIPIIIGEQLQSTLNFLCAFFDHEFQCGIANIHDVSYRLFEFDPLSGVSFSWFSKEQEACDNLRYSRHCHITAVEGKLECLEGELERLEHELLMREDAV